MLSPDATVSKFDANAGGWNGEPGRPGYAHFRWMRKYVALFAKAREARRILEAGGEAVHEIGHVRARAAGEEGCVVRGAEKAWPGA